MNAPPPRYVVRCGSGRHQVNLDPARYWQPARCPACQAPVDPRRWRRAWLWFAGRAPRSRLRLGIVGEYSALDGLALLWLGALLALSVAFRVFGDRWWPVTVLLFLGRWPWLLPAAPLALLALAARRPRAGVFVGLGAAVGLWGVMGFTLGAGRWLGRSDPATRIRVVSYNVALNAVGARIADVVADWRPDVLAIQECGEKVAAALKKIPGYQIDLAGTCLLTRFPIVGRDSMVRDVAGESGGSGWIKRYRLQGPGGEFDFVNLHLETPRKGFEALRWREAGALDEIDKFTAIRREESRHARRWVDGGPGPRIVVGDFNTPGESAIFRAAWGDLTDAFDRAGFGFGYTRKNNFIRIRIDHILADDGWAVRSARVLPDYGSDHHGVMAELERRR